MKPNLPPSEQILEYFLSFDTNEKSQERESYKNYVTYHLHRLIKTLNLLPRLTGNVRALELGAPPYLLTVLIKKYLGYEVTTANFLGDYGEAGHGEDEFVITSTRFRESHTFRCKLFNVELDTFPFPDGHFDLVLCCELIEHLLINPSHMLREAHRVLKPGGWFFLSTPNVTSLHYIAALLRGRNVLHPYTGDSAYARHNREYAPDELAKLLKLHNFDAKVIVDDAYPHGRLHRWLTRLGPLRHRRDNIFAIARASGPPLQRLPTWLYVRPWRYNAGVRQNAIVMSHGDSLQLGPGWHDFDDWPPRFRWTQREATVFLKPQGNETSLIIRGHAGPKRATGRISINQQDAGAFALEPRDTHDAVVPLPETVRAGISDGSVSRIELRLRLDNTFIPAECIPRSTDTRELGIAVERIWLA